MIEQAHIDKVLATASDTPSDLEIAALCMAIARDPKLEITCREGVEMWLDGLDDPQQASQLRERFGFDTFAA